MTKHETSAIDRIPITRSVSYAVRDAPELPAHGATIPGTTLAPTQITFTYQAAPDSQLGRIQARVKGFWMRDGGRVNPGQPMAQHYFDGLTDWPEWLAEEARLHDPEAAVSVPSPAPRADDAFVPPAAEGLPPAALDSATEGANALDAWARSPYGRNFLAHALVQLARDGWLRAEPGKPADRAAVLREAADRLSRKASVLTEGLDDFAIFVGKARAAEAEILEREAEELRRVADEAQQPEPPSAALARQSQETLIRRITEGPCVAGEQQNETPEAEAPVCGHRPDHCWGCSGGCASCQCHAADRISDDEAETP